MSIQKLATSSVFGQLEPPSAPRLQGEQFCSSHNSPVSSRSLVPVSTHPRRRALQSWAGPACASPEALAEAPVPLPPFSAQQRARRAELRAHRDGPRGSHGEMGRGESWEVEPPPQPLVVAESLPLPRLDARAPRRSDRPSGCTLVTPARARPGPPDLSPTCSLLSERCAGPIFPAP